MPALDATAPNGAPLCSRGPRQAARAQMATLVVALLTFFVGFVGFAPDQAHAQAARNAQNARPAARTQQAAAPWFERFTFGNDTASPNALGPNVPRANPPRADVRVTGSNRWGVTFGVQQDNSNPLVAPGLARSTTAGAYYQVSPQLRVSGGVQVRSEAETAAWRRRQEERAQPAVRIESAFRF